MRARHRDHVAEALRALAIRSRHRFDWLGEPSPPLPRGFASLLPEAAARDLLLSRMRARLYESFYCLGGVGTIRNGQDRGLPDADLVAALSAANSGAGSWERGWRLEQERGEELLISREGISVRARPSECRTRNDQGGLLVALPNELPALSPGFFTAVGDLNLDPDDDALVGRLYFNVSRRGAPALVSEVTLALNRARVPFRLKVVDNPDGFDRCDAAVLYTLAADVRRRRRLLRQLVDRCSERLRPRTPVFTKPLAPGVGFAEERSGTGQSFGIQRCGILAEGMLAAHRGGVRDLPGRLAVVEQHFNDAGIDLDAPYLERGSTGEYSL
jgi:HopA1 effector protein family